MLDTTIRLPPFTVRVRSDFDSVTRHLEFFYGSLPCEDRNAFIDFDLRLVAAGGLRRHFRPQVRFLLDDQDPFLPLPASQAAPMLEWGLNWAIATRPLGFLVMHAAVLAKDDQAIVLPGFPGAGKSTLCASLAWLDGWRVLSDELAILDPDGTRLLPNPRPISLKNASIEVVSRFPGVGLGPTYADTRKGTVCHATLPQQSLVDAWRPASCRWVVFPRFVANCRPSSTPISRSEAFALISEQSFNKERMGERGFRALCAMLEGANCHEIEYGSTEDALNLIHALCRA